MTRTITSHQVNSANDTLTITVLDAPGSGGANHAYAVMGGSLDSNPSLPAVRAFADGVPEGLDGFVLLFQNGPIAEAGVNGVTHEVLLAILIDRLEGFQSGQFANPYNQTALDACREAQDALLQRTRERVSRGVEGTHTV